MIEKESRILAVDPGDVRIGIAISDPTGTIANPSTVLKHVKREIDAERIVQIALEKEVVLIIVGQALDDEGVATPSGRKAARLAEAIQLQTDIPVKLWDESNSTKIARQAKIDMGVSRSRRKGHQDDLAATVILQSYLDNLEEMNFTRNQNNASDKDQ
ncbi:MAG: Holliday junction resolvase RuvX [Anaerolineaceae bacterium]|jgi:putative Holliday junction resolvase